MTEDKELEDLMAINIVRQAKNRIRYNNLSMDELLVWARRYYTTEILEYASTHRNSEYAEMTIRLWEKVEELLKSIQQPSC
jgi:hypothetical protein